MDWMKIRVKSKADHPEDESRRSFESGDLLVKQTILKNVFLTQSRRSFFFYFSYIKADDLSENKKG